MSFSRWAATGLMMAGVLNPVVWSAKQARASDSLLDGVENIKREIRDSAARTGRDGLSRLGPWQVSYSGELAAGNIVRFSMEPAAAFRTEREGERNFRVTLIQPDLLFTRLGNLVEMGAMIEVRDLNGGAGSGVCSTGVIFFTNGTRQPINLAQIIAQDPKAVSLSVAPVDKAKFDHFENEKAFFTRISGDATPVNVTLKLTDSGNVYEFNASLPTCGASGGISNPGPAPLPTARPTSVPTSRPDARKKFQMVEVSRTYRNFTVYQNPEDNLSFDHRRRDAACMEAKDVLVNSFLNDVTCTAQAQEAFRSQLAPEGDVNELVRTGTYREGIGYEFVDPFKAEVVPGTINAKCFCSQSRYDSNRDCTYDCKAKGTMVCRVPVILYDIRAIH